MIVRWEVTDGFVGKQRPQETEIDDEELAQFETEEQREEYINECIQEDFNQSISWDRI